MPRLGGLCLLWGQQRRSGLGEGLLRTSDRLVSEKVGGIQKERGDASAGRCY